MAEERGIEPIAVKRFNRNISGMRFLGLNGWTESLLVFQAELAKTDCEDVANGLFYSMSRVTGLPWGEVLQRLRIYIAYAKSGNKQALTCLTHQLMEHLMISSGKMFWKQESLELKHKTIEELLDLLKDNFSISHYSRDRFRKINLEPNRRILGEFLIRLFKEEEEYRLRIVEVLILGEYPINLTDFNGGKIAVNTLRCLVDTEENRAFLAEIDATFDKRMEQEQYDLSVHQKILEAKIAVYLFLWRLGEVKKERDEREQELRREVRSRAGDEHI